MLLIVLLLLFSPVTILAQPATEDLTLQNVPLQVPQRFASLYQDAADSMMLPEGFEIEVFHAGLQVPRFMAWSPEGVLHVAEMEARRIVALPDGNRDGIADSVIVVAHPVDTAHSLAFHDGALYVAEPSRVLRFRDLDGDGDYEQREIFIDGIHSTGPYNHYTRTLLFDEAGGKIYLGVGSSCNACREENPERGAILGFDLDGSNRHVFATGLRNPIGLAIEPSTGRLWATNADRDWLGDDAPPEIITHVEPGSFHGWPFAYADRQWVDFDAEAPEYRALLPLTPADSARVASMQIADVTIHAHSTPMGIIFPDVEKLPPSWRGSALVAVHGSSTGGRPGGAVGYTVIRIRYDSTSARWLSEDFLTGFLTDASAYRFWGRPCGITLDTAGDIYLSSDRGIGAIYRIRYTPPPSSVALPASMPVPGIRVVPNPARGHVTLFYDLPVAADVTIRIYDNLGRVAGVVEQAAQSAGSHRVEFGEALPAGVYRIEMVVGEGESVRSSEGFVVE